MSQSCLDFARSRVMPEEVRHWFELALHVPRRGRIEFLEASCGDHAVRREVVSLLAHDSTEAESEPRPPMFAGLIEEAAESLFGEEPAPPAAHVGHFEVGRLLGTGGMGAVYEGRRMDGEVRQRVAVKFAKLSPLASSEQRESVRRRFLRERQTLASLRHPYIAGLIDAGSTGDGIPYAVIEEVEGEPIDRYCEERRLDQVERIRLILKLCDAVQFAHGKLIVHSDIKPENVLITADGNPKLIDFGVARNLGDERAATSTRAFTPGYASPEQSMGMPPTVATDVYGLGALLFKLLTGAAPRHASGPMRDVIRDISERDVIRPSVLKPELKGDLENILLKALERDPQRRYGSAAELRDDLKRRLASRPVRATPDSALYRARRFVCRNWAPILAAASLAVALATVTVVSIRQKGLATARALENRRLAGKLLLEVHDELEELVGSTKARERLGTIAAEYLKGLERDYARDPEVAWDLLNSYSRLGDSRGGAAASVGDTKSGTELALKTLELGAVVEASSPDAQRLDRLFGLYARQVSVFQEARLPDLQRQTIDRLLRLSPQLRPVRQAQAWKELARYFDDRGSLMESVEAFERAATTLQGLADAQSAEELTTTLVGLGRAQAKAARLPEAVETLTSAVSRAEISRSANPRNARIARQVYWGRIALGDALASPLAFNLGRTTEGVEQYHLARRIAEDLSDSDPANEAAKVDLARALTRAGVALAEVEPERSLALLERAHSLSVRTCSDCFPGLDCRMAYLTASVHPLIRLGQVERARIHLEEARRVAHQLRRGGEVANENGLFRAEAMVLHASGRAKEAVAVAQKHLAFLDERRAGVQAPDFATIELLERMLIYAAGVDVAAHKYATERLSHAREGVSQNPARPGEGAAGSAARNGRG